MKSFPFMMVCLCLWLVSLQANAFELIHNDYGTEFYFVFDGGTDDGVKVQMTACVLDENDDELYCGPVSKVNKTRSGIYAPPEQEAWLEKGLYVRVNELNNSPRNGRKSSTKESTSSLAAGKGSIPKRPSRWNSSLVTTPALPFQFRHPNFSVDARIAGTGDIWTPGEPVKQSLFGASLSRRGPLVNTLDHDIILTWRYIKPIETDVDYDPNSASVYASEKSNSKNFTLAWDVIAPINNDTVSTSIHGGLGAESIDFDYKAAVVDEEGGSQSADLASSHAKLIGLFTKIGARIEHTFGNKTTLGNRGVTGIALSGVIPLYSKTTWSHGTHSLPADTVQKGESTVQLEEAANFKKSVGLEASLFVGWMF